jgi:hypothetical protein
MTRLAWRLGDQEWTVRLARGGGRRVFDQELRSEIVASRAEALDLAFVWLAEVESGSLDTELQPG